MNNTQKPFSQEYVIKTTARHMKKCIDISLKKTYDRIAEFDSNSQMSTEILNTLSTLNSMSRAIDSITGIKEKQNV